jgi:hypothetical protein
MQINRDYMLGKCAKNPLKNTNFYEFYFYDSKVFIFIFFKLT